MISKIIHNYVNYEEWSCRDWTRGSKCSLTTTKEWSSLSKIRWMSSMMSPKYTVWDSTKKSKIPFKKPNKVVKSKRQWGYCYTESQEAIFVEKQASSTTKIYGGDEM